MTEAGARAGLVRFEEVHGTLRAVPPEVWIDSGDTITLVYHGDVPPKLFVPNGAIFGDVLYRLEQSERGWKLELRVLKNAPVIKMPYTLYAPDINQIAEGKSPPRMNINDPGKPDD